MSNKFYKRSDRQALTLVEVITSLVLLSTLLVGMMTAYSRHVRQMNRASDLKTAVELADGWLGAWFSDDVEIFVPGTGAFESNTEFIWRIEEKPGGNVRLVGGRVLQLSVLTSKSGTLNHVMSVELLDALEPAPNEAGQP